MPVLVELGRVQGLQGLQDRLLELDPLGDLGVVLLAWLLLACGQVGERLLGLEALDPLGAGLEVEPEGTLDGDLAVAEVGGREDLGVLALLERLEELGDLADLVGGDLPPLVPRLFRIGVQNDVASMSWTLPLRFVGLWFVRTQM